MATARMIKTALIRSSYDQIATQYAKNRDQFSSLPYIEKLDENLGTNSIVLDLGCGAGLPVDLWLVRHGHRVIGLDISAEMLKMARINVPDARYKLCDIGNLQEGAYSVDAVVCLFTMFHIDRSLHRQLLGCIRSFLETSGLLLITTGQNEWEGEEEFLGVELAWSHFDKATNRDLIEQSGFSILYDDHHRGNSFGDDDWHPIFLARAV